MQHPPPPNQAVSGALIYVSNHTSDELFKTEELLVLNPGGIIGSPAHQHGTLSLSLLVNDGEQFDFLAGAQTNANVSVVPVPAAIWLFGSGLAALVLNPNNRKRLTLHSSRPASATLQRSA